ncbi:MAG: BlaI/MecI/CopY family transcriptional regulator [bacterium]|nr:BlaI/MecI/CopY family transcriptional regulator [bacterium]
MKLSEAEWQIMNALWRKNPATAREIMDSLNGDVRWAYTTVKTMLTRLAAKKAVAETKRGNTSFYTPLVDQRNARRNALQNVVDRVLDGAVAPLMSFLIEDRKLSDRERKELIRMLRDADRKGESDGRDTQ